MNAEQMVEIEERLNGRVLPRWRFWLMYWLVMVSLLAVHLMADDEWWYVAIVAVNVIAYMALFSQYRRRSIR